MRTDSHLCEHCSVRVALGCVECPQCGQLLELDARGRIALWRLGEVEEGLLGPLAERLRETFHHPVVIQPGYVDERPSARPHWSGRSATALLNQMLRRHRRGAVAQLCVTEENITWDSRYAFLFGLAWMGLRVAVMSTRQLRAGKPDAATLVERVCKIAVHELGHGFGLDDMPYGHGDCVMCGDVELDSVETIDVGTQEFCGPCLRQLPVKVRPR